MAALHPSLSGLVASLLVQLLGHHGGLWVGGHHSPVWPVLGRFMGTWDPSMPGRWMGWVQVLTDSKYSIKLRMGFPQRLH